LIPRGLSTPLYERVLSLGKGLTLRVVKN